jgi:hypothetical protein
MYTTKPTFIHIRSGYDSDGRPLPHGGKTIAFDILHYKDEAEVECQAVQYYIAVCPRKQNYNRKIGAQVALGRLLPKRESTALKHPVKTLYLNKDDDVQVRLLKHLGLSFPQQVAVATLDEKIAAIDPNLAAAVAESQAVEGVGLYTEAD